MNWIFLILQPLCSETFEIDDMRVSFFTLFRNLFSTASLDPLFLSSGSIFHDFGVIFSGRFRIKSGTFGDLGGQGSQSGSNGVKGIQNEAKITKNGAEMESK